MKILVTGGAGYIGSHTCLALLRAGHELVVIDNLCNSKASVIQRVEQISGKPVAFEMGDVCDASILDSLFSRYRFDGVVHFAGLKAVGESVSEPLRYYQNNVGGVLTLLAAMRAYDVRTLVFSSSATVYGDPDSVPIFENHNLHATNPYGNSKLMVEDILRDLAKAQPDLSIALLRYFNPVGADESGQIGEDPNGIPNNLLPFIAQVATGQRAQLSVFGNDYQTPDGTGMRDYIHVSDLAEGHVQTLTKLAKGPGLYTYNLGTGRAYSVLDMVRAFELASGRKIPYLIAPRRPGDIAQCYADVSLAERELGWRATRGIEQMCIDTWRWQTYARANNLGVGSA